MVDSPFSRLVMPLLDAHFSPALGPGTAIRRIVERQRALHEAGRRVEVFDMDGLARWLAHETGIPWKTDLAELAERALEGDHHGLVYPDVAPALTALRAAGWRIAAVTNGHTCYQSPILRGLGIAHLFDAVIGPDVASCAKPEPRMLASLGAVRAHVGDLLSQDVHLARRSGVMAVWLCRGEPAALEARLDAERAEAFFEAGPDEVRPDAVIRSLAEVAGVVGLPGEGVAAPQRG